MFERILAFLKQEKVQARIQLAKARLKQLRAQLGEIKAQLKTPPPQA